MGAQPPSEIFKEFFQSQKTADPDEDSLKQLMSKCLLSAEEIKIYLAHVALVDKNRMEGA